MAVTSNKEGSLSEADFRLCRLCTWENYPGFGFNLEATPQSPHLIRCVKSNSPAAAGGLKIRDLLLAINNQDVSESTYQEIATMLQNIKNNKGTIELLVIQQRSYKLLKRKQVVFDPKLAITLQTPATMPDDYMSFPAHTPRTCEISLSEPNQSFGFETIEGENNIGLYIQIVDPNSPANRTSLRQNDRILEINDKFVNNEASDVIIAKLRKALLKRTVKLYVVDTHTYKYFQQKKIPLPSKQYQESPFAKKLSISSYSHENESKC